MKRTKNKIKQDVTWPTAMLFTFPELFSINSKFVKITLRTRLISAVELGKVAEIGSIPGEKGRPQKVYSLTPITKLTLERARAKSINLVDNADKLIHVMNVNNSSSAPASNIITPLTVG